MAIPEKDYSDPGELDLAALERYFTAQGYTVQEVGQLSRHGHVVLEHGGQKFFAKVASRPEIGERTANEVSWNQQVGSALVAAGLDQISVPTIHTTGTFEDKFYYITDYIDGPLLATKFPPNTSKLAPWIEQIVDLNITLLKLSNIVPQRDVGDSTTVEQQVASYVSKAGEWASKVPQYDLNELLAIVPQFARTYTPSLNHGDFVPWHMIQHSNGFVLIDGEHASGNGPRYYDIGYFYHRLYTAGESPNLATEYLNHIRHKLPKGERLIFEVALRPLLASRIIGGYMDTQIDGVTDLKFHDQLKESFLAGDI